MVIATENAGGWQVERRLAAATDLLEGRRGRQKRLEGRTTAPRQEVTPRPLKRISGGG